MSEFGKSHRLTEFVRLNAQELEMFARLLGPPERFPRGHVIQRQGETPRSLHLLVEGWTAASLTRKDGGQQVTKFNLPGDVLGSPSMCLAEVAETIVAATPVTIRRIPIGDFMALFGDSPRFAAAIYLTSLRERVALMDALANVGRSSALERLSALLVDLFDRLSAAGLVRDDKFDLPLTQERLGNHLGLTGVHVNRQIRALKRLGLIEWQGQRVRIVDLDRLAEIGMVVRREHVADPLWLPAPDLRSAA